MSGKTQSAFIAEMTALGRQPKSSLRIFDIGRVFARLSNEPRQQQVRETQGRKSENSCHPKRLMFPGKLIAIETNPSDLRRQPLSTACAELRPNYLIILDGLDCIKRRYLDKRKLNKAESAQRECHHRNGQGKAKQESMTDIH
jgi:hypothetical protein